MKLTRREKSNDDRRTLYFGSQRSRSTLWCDSAQKPAAVASVSLLTLSRKQLEQII